MDVPSKCEQGRNGKLISRCGHPSFNRETYKKSMNIPYHLTCMKGFLCAQKQGSVFLVFCWLHERLATVLVEIVLYFPCALALFLFFPLFFFFFPHCVCVKHSLLVAWWHNIGASLHIEIVEANDSSDLRKVAMCSCWHSHKCKLDSGFSGIGVNISVSCWKM